MTASSKHKYIFFIVTAIFAGFVLGAVITELFMRSRWGDPRAELIKDKVAFYHFDIYRDYFKKAVGADGGKYYVNQRSYVEKESFPEEKRAGTRRIFILGESTAYFFGQSKAEFFEILKEQLPKLKFDIINCGAQGFDPRRIMLILKEIVHYSPDLILLFMGNNPEIEPNFDLSNALTRNLYEKTWIYRYLDRNYLKNHLVNPKPDEILNVHKKTLGEVVEICRGNRVPLVLYTLPLKIKEIPLGATFNIGSSKEYFLARMSMERGNFAEAVSLLRGVMARGNETNAVLLYHLAFCLEKLGDINGARYCYHQAWKYALAYGTVREERNAETRRVAMKEGAVLVDLEKEFAKMAPHGLVGDELMRDPCHWWSSLNPWIFQETLRLCSLNQDLRESVLAESGNWRFKELISRKEALKSASKEKNAGDDYWTALACFVDALSGRFEVPLEYLKKVYQLEPAIILKTASSQAEIVHQFRETAGLPFVADKVQENWYQVLWLVGEALKESKDRKNALVYFNQSLKLRSDQTMAHLFRGLLFFEEKKYMQAEADWKKVMELDGSFEWLKEILRPFSGEKFRSEHLILPDEFKKNADHFRIKLGTC